MAPMSNEKSLNVENILRLKGHEKHRERGKIKVISLLRRDVPESRTKKTRRETRGVRRKDESYLTVKCRLVTGLFEGGSGEALVGDLDVGGGVDVDSAIGDVETRQLVGGRIQLRLLGLRLPSSLDVSRLFSEMRQSVGRGDGRPRRGDGVSRSTHSTARAEVP